MTILDVKKHIQKGQVNSFYIFTGTEWAVMKIYIDKIAACKGTDIKYAETVSGIYHNLINDSFLNQPHCYVFRDNKELMQNEKLLNQFLNGLDIHGNIVILVITEIDKRTKFYKQCKDLIVDFQPLDKATLARYIKKEIDLSDRNCNILIDVCENDYGRILLEIDKIRHFDKEHPDKAFIELLNSGTIYMPHYDAIFDFVKAVLKRDIKRTFELLEDCKGVEENPLALLSVMYTNFKQVLQVQSCESRDIEKSTGLTAWQIRNAKELVGNYRIGELVCALKLIQKAERGIKVGEIDSNIAVQYVLVNIL